MSDSWMALPTLEQPLWLLLLIPLLPAIYYLGRHSLAGVGRVRGWGIVALRMLVATCLVVALAGIHFNRHGTSLSVAYLLDQSDSIPAEHRGEMLAFVQASVDRHRQVEQNDRVAVVAFGREPQVEHPALEYPPDVRQLESLIDGSATNLAAAMQVAASILPTDGARRLVLVTDGNENIGRAIDEAGALAQRGTSIDVISIPIDKGGDVAVDTVAGPPAVTRDQPFEIRVVLSNRGQASSPASGRLRITRQAGGQEEILAEQPITLPPGKSIFTFRDLSPTSDFYVYEARFFPDQAASDRYSRNNIATGYVDVRGRGRVLLIEDFQHPGEFNPLVERLRERGLEIDVQQTTRTFATLAELQRYDVVILANVPYTNDQADSGYTSFSESQISMLVRNTQEMGAGLVVLGGDRSFGAGGWEGTELEKALPVDLRIKNAKVVPVGALAIVLDKSGSMEGQKIRLGVAAAKAAISKLGPRDLINVVTFDGMAYEVVPLTRVGTGQGAIARVNRIGAGGGTDLFPGMAKAYEALKRAEASVKHMIILTDGQTPPNEHANLAARMRREKITVSTIAVGPDADRQLLARIATHGGGKFYSVTNPSAIPRIFMHEAVQVAMPVVRQLDPPVAPLRISDHEILRGVGDNLPPLTGYVQTTLKQSPLVEVLLRSPVPQYDENSSVLVTWTYGLGKVTAFTADAGHNWANAWLGWDHYDQFFEQLVRWSMRPVGEDQRFVLTTSNDGQQTQLVIDAIDDEAYLDSLGMYGQVVGPDLEALPVTISQTAPGRYVGTFDTPQQGTYFVTIAPAQGGAVLRAGVNVTASREYQSDAVNVPLLESIAQSTPPGGKPGQLVPVDESLRLASSEGNPALQELNPYRRDQPMPVSSRDAWPLLVFAASCLFAGDVLLRRVHIDWAWLLGRLTAWRSATSESAAEQTLNRLRSRKEGLREQFATAQQHYRPPTGEVSEGPSPLEELKSPATGTSAASKAAQPIHNQTDEPEDYTSRLLAAKRRAIPPSQNKRD